MKKLTFALSLFVLLALLLAGCAGVQQTAPAASDEAAAAPSSEGATLTLMASQGWVKDAELELAQKFEEETGIHEIGRAHV